MCTKSNSASLWPKTLTKEYLRTVPITQRRYNSLVGCITTTTNRQLVRIFFWCSRGGIPDLPFPEISIFGSIWLTAFVGLGKQDVALKYLKMSIKADPSDDQTWYILGRCYMSQKKYRRAYDAYQQVNIFVLLSTWLPHFCLFVCWARGHHAFLFVQHVAALWVFFLTRRAFDLGSRISGCLTGSTKSNFLVFYWCLILPNQSIQRLLGRIHTCHPIKPQLTRGTLN